MQTLVCTADYAQKILNMKKAGLAVFVKALVILTDAPDSLFTDAENEHVQVYRYDYVMQ